MCTKKKKKKKQDGERATTTTRVQDTSVLKCSPKSHGIMAMHGTMFEEYRKEKFSRPKKGKMKSRSEEDWDATISQKQRA